VNGFLLFTKMVSNQYSLATERPPEMQGAKKDRDYVNKVQCPQIDAHPTARTTYLGAHMRCNNISL
jgi:hypothetical protein